MIEINEIVQLNGKDVLLKSFNYQTVIFSSTQNLAKKQEDKIVINQVDFELAFNYQNGRDCIYTVKNLSEIVDTSEFKQLINQWVKEERVIDDSYATY
jgi:hypothetical protein